MIRPTQLRDSGDAMASNKKKTGPSEDFYVVILTLVLMSTVAAYVFLLAESAPRVLPYLRPFYPSENAAYREITIVCLMGLAFGLACCIGCILVIGVTLGLCLRIGSRWMTEDQVAHIVGNVERTRFPLFRPIFFLVYRDREQ